MNASDERIKKIEIWKQDRKLLAPGGGKPLQSFPAIPPNHNIIQLNRGRLPYHRVSHQHEKTPCFSP